MSSGSFKLPMRALDREEVQHCHNSSWMRTRPAEVPTWRAGTHSAHSNMALRENQLSHFISKLHVWIWPQWELWGGRRCPRPSVHCSLSWDWGVWSSYCLFSLSSKYLMQPRLGDQTLGGWGSAPEVPHVPQHTARAWHLMDGSFQPFTPSTK